jgi:hypothetical protein
MRENMCVKKQSILCGSHRKNHTMGRHLKNKPNNFFLIHDFLMLESLTISNRDIF